MSTQARVTTETRETVIPGKEKSFWVDTTPDTDYPSLTQGITVDVAVLGGGIAGITAAYYLKEAGLSVAVLEANRIVKRVSGHTTAKLTSNQGAIYRDMIAAFGEEKARIYAAANQRAIDSVEELALTRKIACDFKRVAAYTYSDSKKDRDTLQAEAEAAQRLGLPAYFTEDVPLPFGTHAGAVCFTGQARFHPRKFLLALAEGIPGDGSHVFEYTRALAIAEGAPCTVTTDRGDLKARDVIVATWYPFVMEGEYFSKLYPHQSHMFAVRIGGAFPDDMFYSLSPDFETIRAHPSGGDQVLICGGQVHKTGQGGNISERYRWLERYLRSHLPVEAIDYHWTTEDAMSLDGLPYIGKITRRSDHTWLAAGFGGWGMTNGIVAGQLLADLVRGRANPWSAVYDPARSKPLSSVRRLFQENLNVAKEFIAGHMPREEVVESTLEKLANGQARVMRYNNEKIAVYKDGNGAVHAVSARCTHMGCTVGWDDAYKTWDCPCHGSRYTYEGKVIQGPAAKNLAPVQLPPDAV